MTPTMVALKAAQFSGEPGAVAKVFRTADCVEIRRALMATWPVRLSQREPWSTIWVGAALGLALTLGRSAQWYAQHSWWEILGTSVVVLGLTWTAAKAVLTGVYDLRHEIDLLAQLDAFENADPSKSR